VLHWSFEAQQLLYSTSDSHSRLLHSSTKCIYVFCMVLRIKSDYFPPYSINWLVSITETEFVYGVVRTNSHTKYKLIFVFRKLNDSNATLSAGALI
jgi:hypothetical protein